jgi:hypothetical protein
LTRTAAKNAETEAVAKVLNTLGVGVGLAGLGLNLKLYNMRGKINEISKQLTTNQAEMSKRFDKLELILSSMVR